LCTSTSTKAGGGGNNGGDTTTNDQTPARGTGGDRKKRRDIPVVVEKRQAATTSTVTLSLGIQATVLPYQNCTFGSKARPGDEQTYGRSIIGISGPAFFKEANGDQSNFHLAFPAPEARGASPDNCLYVDGVGTDGTPLRYNQVLDKKGISFIDDSGDSYVLRWQGGTTELEAPIYVMQTIQDAENGQFEPTDIFTCVASPLDLSDGGDDGDD